MDEYDDIEQAAMALIRFAVNAARRRLHLPTRDYSNTAVGQPYEGHHERPAAA